MFSKKDSVLLYLIHLGYLAYDLETGSVYSPNEETRRELIKSVEESKHKMEKAAAELDFNAAAKFRDEMWALQEYLKVWKK